VALPRAAWYEVRRAQNRKPSTYTCPVCGRLMPAMIPHALVTPEGDPSRRRHAHLACVVTEREAGRLPTRDDVRRAERAATPRRRWWRWRTGS
jgi:hypothetical protein